MAKCHEINKRQRDGIAPKSYGERFAQWFHLLICKNCARYEKGLQQMSAYAKEVLRAKRSPDTGDLERRIVEEIKKKKV